MRTDRLPLSELTRLRVEPVIAYQARVPDWALDMEVRNPFFTWWLVEKGQVRLKWAGGDCEVNPGWAVLIPPGLLRHQSIEAGTRMVSVSFWAGWDDGRVLMAFDSPLLSGGKDIGPLPRKAKALCLMIAGFSRAHVHLRDLQTDPETWLKIRAAADVFVSEIMASYRGKGVVFSLPDNGDRRLHRILTDLGENLRAGPLPYAKWRKQTGLSKVQLDRLAQRWIGNTLRHRRDDMLLQEIWRSLSNDPDSLKEISARLGFFDAAHFSRWVKRRTQKSPKALRNSWA